MITFCNLCQIFGYFVGNGVALHLRDILLLFFKANKKKSVGLIEISPEGYVWVWVALARFPSTARKER